MYYFCFNFILFGHTGHANFCFNWCSVLTENYFSFEKGLIGQNHSSSGFHWLAKNTPTKVFNSLPPPLLIATWKTLAVFSWMTELKENAKGQNTIPPFTTDTFSSWWIWFSNVLGNYDFCQLSFPMTLKKKKKSIALWRVK